MYKLAIVYESGKRYVFDIKKFDKIIDEKMKKKLEVAVKKEVSKL